MNESTPAPSPEDVAERIVGAEGGGFAIALASNDYEGFCTARAALKQAIVDAIKAAQQ